MVPKIEHEETNQEKLVLKNSHVRAQSLFSVCLCDPMDCSPPGFCHGIPQEIILD